MQKRLKFLAPRHWTLANIKETTPIGEKIIFLDLDNYLEQSKSLSELRNKLENNAFNTVDIQLGILTGRSIEAAASGLPMVTTDDGGPRDILSRCDNGLLVDVTDLEAFRDGFCLLYTSDAADELLV